MKSIRKQPVLLGRSNVKLMSPEAARLPFGSSPPLSHNVAADAAKQLGDRVEVGFEKLTAAISLRIQQLDATFGAVNAKLQFLHIDRIEVELGITADGKVAIAPFGMGTEVSSEFAGTIRVELRVPSRPNAPT